MMVPCIRTSILNKDKEQVYSICCKPALLYLNNQIHVLIRISLWYNLIKEINQNSMLGIERMRLWLKKLCFRN